MRRPLELHREKIDLVQLVQRVVADHQQAATSHPIRVRTTLAALHGCWDAARLERVLGNLLSNAVKYSPEGSEIEVDLEREEAEEEPLAVVSVRDQGVGIPAHDLPHVFDRFYRASNVIGRIAGTGIGLAGAMQLVEAHGGTIRVESAPGEGSTFFVRLPLSATLCEVD
jgi:signal transduction histidine kinase